MSSHPYLPIAKEKGPARPPNAWIIYRKTKFRTLPPLQPGEPRRAQADVSKMISKMWREEPDSTKAEYERMAEAEKAEHQRMFPGYKFTPESKAEKEKKKKARQVQKEWERANAKKTRGRTAAPYIVPVQQPVIPLPSGLPPAAYYDPASMYGPAGPSPHTSGAASPTSSKSGSVPLPYEPTRSTSQRVPSARSSTRSSPSSDAYHVTQQDAHSLSTPPDSTYGVPMPPIQHLHHPELVQQQQQHLPLPNHYDQQHQFAPQHQIQQPQAQITSWPQNPANGSQVTLQGVTAQDVASYQLWDDQQGGGVHHATAFATGDPAIFSLEGIDFNDLLDNPQGEIEVSLGTQMPYAFDPQAAESFANFAQMFENFDYSQPLDFSQIGDNNTGSQSRVVSAQHASTPAYYPGPSETPMSRVPSNTGTPQVNDIMTPAASPPYFNDGPASRVASSSYPTPQGSQSVHSSYGQDAFQQYFNLDAHGPAETTPPRHVSGNVYPQPEMPQYMTTHEPSPPQQQAQYTPPVGATNNGSRRVGASWKPPRVVEPDSPLDHAPTGTWTYPVAARS